MPEAPAPPPDPSADYRRRVLAFAVIEAAFLAFVVLPILVWLFVLDNDLSERNLVLYAVGAGALQLAVSLALLWWLRLLKGPPRGA